MTLTCLWKAVVLVVPPAVRKSLMGIDRYVSSDFVGGRGVESGLIGNLYGVDIYVSSNAPVVEAAGQNSASSDDTRGCLFFHSDALVMAEQMAVRSQTQYKQEYLSTLFTSDCSVRCRNIPSRSWLHPRSLRRVSLLGGQQWPLFLSPPSSLQ